MNQFENITFKKESISGADKAIFQKIKSLIDSKSDFRIFTKENKIDFDKIDMDLIGTFESCQYPVLSNLAYKLEDYLEEIEDKKDKVLSEEEKKIVLNGLYNVIKEGFDQILN